ncbi:MAG: hypothetical protein COB54_08755 [Alphaproteobacteria bacterium]|nr:MAG: hypothetical protein COB54_08755 [Alphaproteobacteria bacterium]
MKDLFKIILILLLVFSTALIIAKTTGFLNLDQIEGWFKQAQDAPPLYIAALVIGLLVLDLFITVPTLGLVMLSGYFLGYPLGVLAALSGLMLAGCTGYLLSYLFGGRVLRFLIRDPARRHEMTASFHRHAFTMILLSRALPMLPEVTSCLSGSTRLPFLKFLGAWTLSSLPYVLIAAYSGSRSSLNNPEPALFTAIGMMTILWLGGFLVHRARKST